MSIGLLFKQQFFALSFCLLATSAAAQAPLIERHSIWSYFDAGANLGQAWRSNDFVANWPAGEAPLGYGESDLATPIGINSIPKPVTIYFRHEFILNDPSDIHALTLALLCDDGAVVYLNGTEVYRRNLPAGPIDSQTAAVNLVEGAQEQKYSQYIVLPYLLQPGRNVLAVELHQHPAGLGDARFDLELIPNLPVTWPEVRIVEPANGQVLDSGPVHLRVEASDRDGFVYFVRYYVDGQFVGVADVEPFDFLWSPVTDGRYRLTAEAIDNSGRGTLSPFIYFQVGQVTTTSVSRGPYLQSGSATGIVVRWRTDWPGQSWLRFGTNAQSLTQTVTGPAGIDHEVKVSGLQPETTYYYSVGDEAGPITGGSGSDFYFTTASDRTRPIRIWAIGDSGNASTAAAEVRNAYMLVSGKTDVWLMLGDNAYPSGTDDQYERAVFDMYPTLLRHTVVWPTLGNHDAYSPGTTEAFPYLDIFTLPRNGEAGGLASGSELYYSFDQANIHFVCLDAQSSDRSPQGPMLRWLESDLAATAKDWIIAYWHHPPYTWGTHTSDSETELIEMRQFAGPILESYGVDLVLCGHSHVYERSYLLNGHYGHSSTLAPSMMIDAGSGSPFRGELYHKPAGGIGAHQGTVYVVCGCSGEGGYFFFNRHPAMYFNRAGYGSMVIDVNGLRLDGRFVTDDADVADWFVIDKTSPNSSIQPRIDIRRVGAGVELSWPTADPLFQLESRPTVDASQPWQVVPAVPETFGRRQRLRRDADGTNRIFRLRSGELRP